MQLGDAINLLRPELSVRDVLLNALDECLSTLCTYFSTIPMDIVGIIREYVPKLRRKYTEADVQKIHSDALEQYDRFSARYLTHTNVCPYLNLRRLHQDYPELPQIFDIRSIYIKIINGQLRIYNESNREPVYIGNNHFGLLYGDYSYRLTKNTDKMIIGVGSSDRLPQMQVVKLLPCGLVLVQKLKSDATNLHIDKYNWMLVDPYSRDNDCIEIISCDSLAGMMPIDDYGNRSCGKIDQYCFNALKLCDSTGPFLRVYGKY